MNMSLNSAFTQLQPPEPELPNGFEKEVFASLETLQLIADVIDLFTSQFIMSEAELTNMLGGSFYDDAPEGTNDEQKDTDDTPEDTDSNQEGTDNEQEDNDSENKN